MNVRQLMTRRFVSLPPEVTVLDAARTMREQHVGSVVVVAAGAPLGILTDRDIVVRVVALNQEHVDALALREVLARAPITVNEDDPFDIALARMRRHAVRRLPVVDSNGVLVGVIALDDILRRIASELGEVSTLIEEQA
jgi:CBS domain-containing protein